ncbi:GNAT family N-acetyltransferase [Bacillus salitolerans]|uniref:GNAT family N-acetyltransferase n=1 Tax=Bacillus salitolerans TaxID=1437434 RepID=A0ABW4LTN7_9BACI
MSLTFRAARISDIEKLSQLIRDYDLDTLGEIETSEEDVKGLLAAIDNLETHSWIVEKEDRVVIGFAGITKKGTHFPSLVIVHPTYRHNGIEQQLIEKMRLVVSGGTLIVSSNTDYEHQLFSENGFKAARHWFTMKRSVDAFTSTPSLPPSLVIEPFVLNQDEEAVHQAFEESFSTHFGYEPSSLNDFLERTNREGFDPNLWFLLKDQGEIAGFIFCKRGIDHHAEITHVGVRPQWRKRGFGKVLLEYAFLQLRNEGRTSIHLDVDTENGTGAVKVYKTAGMEIARHFIRFDKAV